MIVLYLFFIVLFDEFIDHISKMKETNFNCVGEACIKNEYTKVFKPTDNFPLDHKLPDIIQEGERMGILY